MGQLAGFWNLHDYILPDPMADFAFPFYENRRMEENGCNGWVDSAGNTSFDLARCLVLYSFSIVTFSFASKVAPLIF